MDSLASVSEMINHPHASIQLTKNGGWNWIIDKKSPRIRRQDFTEDSFWINGSLYLSSFRFATENRAILVPGKTFPFKSANKFIFDIDEKDDLDFVRFIMRYNYQK